MKKYLTKYLTTLLIFYLIDSIWLGIISKNLYENNIGHLMGDLNIIPAIVFYLLYPFGLLHLVIIPLLEEQNIKKYILLSLLFGITTYATYDLTNLATLKDWSVMITVIDIAWGGLLALTTTLISFKILTEKTDRVYK